MTAFLTSRFTLTALSLRPSQPTYQVREMDSATLPEPRITPLPVCASAVALLSFNRTSKEFPCCLYFHTLELQAPLSLSCYGSVTGLTIHTQPLPRSQAMTSLT